MLKQEKTRLKNVENIDKILDSLIKEIFLDRDFVLKIYKVFQTVADEQRFF